MFAAELGQILGRTPVGVVTKTTNGTNRTARSDMDGKTDRKNLKSQGGMNQIQSIKITGPKPARSKFRIVSDVIIGHEL